MASFAYSRWAAGQAAPYPRPRPTLRTRLSLALHVLRGRGTIAFCAFDGDVGLSEEDLQFALPVRVDSNVIGLARTAADHPTVRMDKAMTFHGVLLEGNTTAPDPVSLARQADGFG